MLRHSGCPCFHFMVGTDSFLFASFANIVAKSNNCEYFIGRSYEMAPEIDGLIYIKKHKGINIGDIIKVKITDVMEYDLIGEIFDEFSK